MRSAPRRRDERGAAVVEFALVLVPLLVILFGIVDFALAFNAQQAVTASAREGVRVVALSGPDPIATAKSAGKPIPPDELNPVVTASCDPENPGTAGHMTVTHTFEFLSPLPGLIPGFPETVTLTGEGEMRCGG